MNYESKKVTVILEILGMTGICFYLGLSNFKVIFKENIYFGQNSNAIAWKVVIIANKFTKTGFEKWDKKRFLEIFARSVVW